MREATPLGAGRAALIRSVLPMSRRAIVAAGKLAAKTSWRDSAPEDVQAMFDGLFGLAIDAALEMLTNRKEFYPFGFEGQGDEAVMVGGEPGLGDRPESQAVLDVLYEGSRSRGAVVDAVGYACDVRLESGSDAVRVDLEHRDGHTLQIVMPYRLKRFGRGVEAGQVSVSSGVRRIWA